MKPENILLTEHNGCDIKLIDFGSSSHSGSCFFSYIQSRYYRAPEVILGLPYTSSIDMWSVACVLVIILIQVHYSLKCVPDIHYFEEGMNKSKLH